MKDLKQEYEQMILSDIPDIWDRIETRLFTTEESADSPAELSAEEKPSSNKVTTLKKTNKTKIYRWATVFAACLCVLLILPLVNITRSRNESAPAALETSGGYAKNEGLNAMDSNAMAEAAPMEENAEEVMEEAAPMEENAEEVMAEAAAEEIESDMSTSEKRETASSMDNEVIEEVTAQITSPIMEQETLIGFEIMVLKDSHYFYERDSIQVYFSPEYDPTSFELSTNAPEKEYFIHIIYNKETSQYELLDIK